MKFISLNDIVLPHGHTPHSHFSRRNENVLNLHLETLFWPGQRLKAFVFPFTWLDLARMMCRTTEIERCIEYYGYVSGCLCCLYKIYNIINQFSYGIIFAAVHSILTQVAQQRKIIPCLQDSLLIPWTLSHWRCCLQPSFGSTLSPIIHP